MFSWGRQAGVGMSPLVLVMPFKPFGGSVQFVGVGLLFAVFAAVTHGAVVATTLSLRRSLTVLRIPDLRALVCV